MSITACRRDDGNFDLLEDNKFLITVSRDDILELFNTIVPETIYEPFLLGDTSCKHSWRPWNFNDKFMICSKCPAMQKIKRLVPKQYE